ncbi:MAG TPA: two-component regulator propeller domain-containing protein, partial [Chitinophagaceae bacterium]|nr:two-component regulator propeller domain-containing protein [Chitinophagaceae bacterium]
MDLLGHIKCFLLIIHGVLLYGMAIAQTPPFSHLTTSDGLTDNNIRSLALDKKGFLWVGTPEGLNVYDGYGFHCYTKETQPQMASNNVIHLTCDSRNRIWLGTYEGITWLDEKRKFHRVVLYDSISKFASRTIVDTKAYGPVLYTNLGQFYFNEGKKKWQRLEWIPEFLKFERFHDADPFDENRILYATDSLVLLVDYANKKILFEEAFASVSSLCRYNSREIAIGLPDGLVAIVDIQTHQTTKQFILTSPLDNKPISTVITEVRLASTGDLLVGTAQAGLFVIDKLGTITNYVHDPVNPRSLGVDMIWRVLGSDDGDVIVGTTLAGLSIFNNAHKMAGHISVFRDEAGNYYDSYLSEIVEGDPGIMWIGAFGRLIRWDRKRNRSRFYYYYSSLKDAPLQSYEIRSLCVDRMGRIWAGTLGDGVSLLDETTGKFKKIKTDTLLGPALKNEFILDLYAASNGMIWVASVMGIYTIHPTTFQQDGFNNHRHLEKMAGKRVNSFLEDKKGRMWMATQVDGVYCYDKAGDTLLHYTKLNGIASNQCFTIFEDSRNNIYVTTSQGFSKIPRSGPISSFGKKDGLRYNRCDA